MISQRAFTLIESLISLAIIAILMAMTLPSLRHFYLRATDDVVHSQLLRTLELAQQTARARHAAVTLCKSKDHFTCSGDWSDGQIVFVQDNNQIVSVVQSYSGTLRMRSYPYYNDYLVFQPSGIERTGDATFWYCHSDTTTPAWAILLSKTGRARTVYADKNSEIKDTHGNPLIC